jgi:hypothetical protein
LEALCALQGELTQLGLFVHAKRFLKRGTTIDQLRLQKQRTRVGALAESLNQMLLKLDSCLSYGRANVRRRRKLVVKHVERLATRAEMAFQRSSALVALAAEAKQRAATAALTGPPPEVEQKTAAAAPSTTPPPSPPTPSSPPSSPSAAVASDSTANIAQRPPATTSPGNQRQRRRRQKILRYGIEEEPDAYHVLVNFSQPINTKRLKVNTHGGRRGTITVQSEDCKPLQFALDFGALDVEHATYELDDVDVLRLRIPKRRRLSRSAPLFDPYRMYNAGFLSRPHGFF